MSFFAHIICSHTAMSCSSEVVSALGRGEDVCGVADGLPEFGDGAGGAALEVGLEPGEGHLDRVEIGAVGGQESTASPASSARLIHQQ